MVSARSARSAHTALLVLLVVGAGCSDESIAAVVQPPEPCAAADVGDCLVNQQACELQDGAASCVACEAGSFAAATGSCEPIPGTAMHHDFAEFTTQPGEEVLGLCQSWTLGNETELWVNTVELAQDEMSHHSNWTFVPDDKYAGPDGVWPCDDRGYDQLSAAVAGGVLYAQSTQATREVQKFPEGAAVRIPPHARIIGDVHLLNVGDAPVTGHLGMTLYTIAADTVKVRLAPFHMTYEELDIPPLASSRFASTCDLAEPWQSQLGGAVSMKLYYALPHTHKLGTHFFLEAVGGARDGESLIDVSGFNGEARGRLYEPAIDLAGISGLRFGCEFENPRDQVVHWGFGDQEMCEMLGFIESPVAFESSVHEATPDGSDNDIQLFTGTCSTLMVPWQAKL